MGAVKEKYEGKFTGTSKYLDFREALENAITAAKDALGADHVEWSLANVTGESGGINPENNLHVTIQTIGPETSRS